MGLGRIGQAAMEFLMTYGWAILAAIVSISVLIYFGILGKSTTSGNIVVISPPFYTTASQVVLTTSSANFEIVNKGGYNVQVSSITINGTGPSLGVNCLNNVPVAFQADELTIFNIPCTGNLEVGKPFAGDIKIFYTVGTSQISQIASGTIQTTVQN